MGKYDSFIKNNLVVLLGHLLIFSQGLILMPIIIKTIGIKVYGGYGILITLVGFIMGISSLGVGFRRSRYLPAASDWKKRQALFYPQFYASFFTLMLASLLLIFTFPLFDKFLLKGEISFSVWLVVPYFIFYLMYAQTSDYFRYTDRIHIFNFSTVSHAFLNVGFILVLFYFACQLTVDTLFTVQIVSSLLVALPLAVLMIHEIGLRFKLPSWEDLAEDVKLGFPLVLVYVIDFILNSSDRYVITAFMSITAVGYYSSAYSLGSFIVLLPKISGVVLPPHLSKAVDTGNEAEARVMVNYTIKGFLLAAIPFVVGGGVMSKPLLILLTNYEVAQNAYLVTPIVALGTLFYGLNVILSNVLFVRLRTGIILKANILAAIVNLGLNLVILYFIKNILVAALSTLLCFFMAFVFIHREVSIDWPIDYDFKTIAKSVLASIIMGVAICLTSSWLNGRNLGIYVIGEIGFGTIVYCIAIMLLKTFSPQEISKVKEFMAGRGRSRG